MNAHISPTTHSAETPIRAFMRVHAGLGNQMFQYAAAVAIRDLWRADVVLDLSVFNRWTKEHPRPCRLGAFLLELPTYEPSCIEAVAWRWLTSRRPAGRLKRALRRAAGLALVDDAPPPPERPVARRASLLGYWQDPVYLAGCEDRLRRAFRFACPPTGANAAALHEIARNVSVAVHFRRGDYAAAGLTLPMAYYRQALDQMASRVSGARYYVFSDEPGWAARQDFLPGERTVVDWNSAKKPEEDLRLMAACKHHIIANSTLSWWGAWLAASPGQVVLAPQQWISADPAAHNPLVLPGWTALDAGRANR